MEDPWGSPWTAAEPSREIPSKEPPPAASDLEPPARAFFNANNSQAPKITHLSPWADEDDGFGDWSSASPAPASSWNTGWLGSAGNESLSPLPQLAPTPKQEEFSKGSPIAWPGSAATSPGLRARSRTDSSSFFPPPSPDPWANHDVSPAPSVVLSSRKEDTIREPSPVRLDLDSSHVDAALSIPAPSITNDQGIQEGKEADRSPEPGYVPVQEHDRDPVQDTDAGATEDLPLGSDDRLEDPRAISRPSSPDSDGSRGREGHQDSPITSIDEEARTRPDLQQRKASSKVQNLVVMYDGLAQPADPTLPIEKTREDDSGSDEAAGSGSASSPVDDGGDFGDFEDADQTQDGESLQDTSVDITPPKDSIVLDGAATSKTTEGDYVHTNKPATVVHGLPQQGTKAITPVDFNVDLELISKLFKPQDSAESADKGGDKAVSDRIITDSFTTISERRTWYRISRQGTLRRHNVGDDDNYRYVSWKTSAIHADTIKIVRRWMEEDSITGRPTFKGGTSKGNMFGWDSAAEPVSLDKVFAMRKKKKPARKPEPLSFPPVRTPEATSGSGPSTGTTQRASLSKLPEPASPFSWSSQRPSLALSSPALPRASADSSRDATTSISSIPAPHAASESPAPAAVIKTTTFEIPQSSVVADDDDDEWGEMVVSPQEPPANLGGLDSFLQIEVNNGVEPVGGLEDKQQAIASQVIDSQSAVTLPVTPIPSQEAPSQAAPYASPASVDPWQSVDFSIWDTPAPAARPETLSKPATLNTERAKTPAVMESAPPRPESSRVSTPPISMPATATISRAPASTPNATAPKAGNAAPASDSEGLITRVIADLPDLSYMLR